MKNKKQPDNRKARVQRLSKKNGRTPLVLTPDEATPPRLITIPVNKLEELGIDEELYQRHEIKSWVDELIRVLQAGGYCPTPIEVVERPDGSLWIVDGQQRWWAHVMAEKSIRALLYKVKSLETERRMFLISNSSRAVQATNWVKAWGGEATAVVVWMNKDSQSPLRGDINFGQGGSLRVPASTVAKSILAVLTGLGRVSHIKDVMPRLGEAVATDKPLAYKKAQMLGVVISNVFHDSHCPAMGTRALALLCHEHWGELKKNDAFPTPSRRQMQRLRRMNWVEWGASNGRLPILLGEIKQIWPPA